MQLGWREQYCQQTKRIASSSRAAVATRLFDKAFLGYKTDCSGKSHALRFPDISGYMYIRDIAFRNLLEGKIAEWVRTASHTTYIQSPTDSIACQRHQITRIQQVFRKKRERKHQVVVLNVVTVAGVNNLSRNAKKNVPTYADQMWALCLRLGALVWGEKEVIRLLNGWNDSWQGTKCYKDLGEALRASGPKRNR